ncbi:O-antigen ligase family protein, partial [Candidatus Saccharibacteria bacterium]|nr:O-antigen ligase family protein [Candidatus Saccharibacteria bacterium]
ALAGGVALGASYSRGALIGAAVAIATILYVSFSGRIRQKIAWLLVAAVVVVAGSVYVLRDSEFVANVILHDSPTTGAMIDSNTAHVDSLAKGVSLVATKPLGSGIGSTGSASLTGNKPLIIENQYLFIAHEVGWVGLLLFVWLFVEIMKRLWISKKSFLALGVFASGLGIAVIGLFLPVWADDTVSIVWWGLAAVGIGSMELGIQKMTKGKKKHDS